MKICGELIQARVEYAKEQTGFAPYGSDDPPVIRVVAAKPENEV